MALESGTVYEALRAGVSQGLFTISNALQGNNTWIGEGSWKTASELAASAAAAAKKKEARSKPAPEPVEGPPVLRRASSAKIPEPSSTPPAQPGPTPAPAPAASAPPSAPTASTSALPAESTDEEDPDRPVLKRGAPAPAEKRKQTASSSGPVSPKGNSRPPSSSAPVAPGSVQLIPAISDADGPDPRPYAYVLKPDEGEKLRKKILALAADEVRTRAAQLENRNRQSRSRSLEHRPNQ